jgi:hypothetical protein
VTVGEVILHTEAWSRDPSAKTSLSQNEKGFFTGDKGAPLKALFKPIFHRGI